MTVCLARVKRNEVHFLSPNLAAAIKRLVLRVFSFLTFSFWYFLHSFLSGTRLSNLKKPPNKKNIYIDVSGADGTSCSRRRASV